MGKRTNKANQNQQEHGERDHLKQEHFIENRADIDDGLLVGLHHDEPPSRHRDISFGQQVSFLPFADQGRPGIPFGGCIGKGGSDPLRITMGNNRSRSICQEDLLSGRQFAKNLIELILHHRDDDIPVNLRISAPQGTGHRYLVGMIELVVIEGRRLGSGPIRLQPPQAVKLLEPRAVHPVQRIVIAYRIIHIIRPVRQKDGDIAPLPEHGQAVELFQYPIGFRKTAVRITALISGRHKFEIGIQARIDLNIIHDIEHPPIRWVTDPLTSSSAFSALVAACCLTAFSVSEL
ncbi:hypothetical protein D1872_223730 [compost metagenome]